MIRSRLTTLQKNHEANESFYHKTSPFAPMGFSSERRYGSQKIPGALFRDVIPNQLQHHLLQRAHVEKNEGEIGRLLSLSILAQFYDRD